MNKNHIHKKNIELTNKNNNLETKVRALEQRIHDAERRKLCKWVEIHNSAKAQTSLILQIAQLSARKLEMLNMLNVCQVETNVLDQYRLNLYLNKNKYHG